MPLECRRDSRPRPATSQRGGHPRTNNEGNATTVRAWLRTRSHSGPAGVDGRFERYRGAARSSDSSLLGPSTGPARPSVAGRLPEQPRVRGWWPGRTGRRTAAVAFDGQALRPTQRIRGGRVSVPNMSHLINGERGVAILRDDPSFGWCGRISDSSGARSVGPDVALRLRELLERLNHPLDCAACCGRGSVEPRYPRRLSARGIASRTSQGVATPKATRVQHLQVDAVCGISLTARRAGERHSAGSERKNPVCLTLADRFAPGERPRAVGGVISGRPSGPWCWRRREQHRPSASSSPW